MTSAIPLVRRIGPAVVVAAVVLGPGSIVSASRVGCQYGYQLLWVVPLASVLMIAMTMTAMSVGLLQKQTPCQAVSDSFGRPAAWLVGLAMLVAVTMFQASNNNALLMAAEGFVSSPALQGDSAAESSGESVPGVQWGRIATTLAFNLIVVALLWASRRDLYRVIEKAMAWMVGAMVLAFATNLIFASPSLSEILRGLVPGLTTDPSRGNESGVTAASWMTTGALLATTFSVAAAFYQSYQVREKGWTAEDLRLGRLDTLVGIGALGLITLMILVTAAAALHGVVDPGSLTDASAVARSLEPTFGPAAQYVFAGGVMAGAVSSFVVNALIGAVVFCDAIGLSTSLSDTPVRRTTVAVLLLGWAVSVVGVVTNTPLTDFIVVAQALTVIAFPILAATVIWQARRLPGGSLPVWVMPLNYLGLLVTLGLSVRTVARLIGL